MNSERKMFAEAFGHAKSRLIEYVQSGKDPAFAFRAYLWSRVAAQLKDAAIEAVCYEAIQLSSSAGIEPNESDLACTRHCMNRDFSELQEAIFRVLDEIAELRITATPHGSARANRFRAAYMTAEEARRVWETGSGDEDVRKLVAKRIDTTPANVRRLVDLFHNDAGTQAAANRVFGELRRRLAERRKVAAPKKKRSTGAHPWREARSI